MKHLRLFFLPLVFFIITFCSKNHVKFQELRPNGVDGIIRFQMNDTSLDDHFFGVWSAPRVGRDKRFYRVILESDSGITFTLLKKEPIFIEAEFAQKASNLKIRVNETPFPVLDNHFGLIVPSHTLNIGTNRIFFSFLKRDQITVKHVRIYPKRFFKLRNTFNLDSDFLTPCTLHYFLNPESRTKLHLAFIFKGPKPIQAIIKIESEKSKKQYQQTILAKEDFPIKPIDRSFHHILIEIPQTESGHIRLIQSQIFSRQEKQYQNPSLKNLSRNKNILIILLDAARADHMSCYNYHRKTTPHIDALTEKGFVFRNVISEAAYTLASTGTLLTGLPPDFHGVVSAFFSSLNEGIITFPQLLQQKGYFTAAITSTPYFGRAYNFDKGFNEFIELFEQKGVVMAEDFLHPFEEILEKIKDKPFFLYLHLREPHPPYSMPKPFFGKYQKKYPDWNDAFNEESSSIYSGHIKDQSDLQFLTDIYDENLAYADFAVGKLLQILEEKNLSDKTIKIIVSDHGEALGEHGMVGHNVVLHKEGIHIPLIIHIPGASIQNRSLDHPVITSDLIVTLCNLLNLPYPYAKTTMGRSLFTPAEKRTRISRSVVLNNKFSGYMVESFPHKLIIFPTENKTSLDLFNISLDLEEKEPLSNIGLVEKALMFFLNDFIKRASQGVRIGEKPKLGKRELEILKSLGYIHYN